MSNVTVLRAVPVLFVTDFKAAIDHYQQCFGFEIGFCNNEYCYAGLRRGDVEIHIGQGQPTGQANRGAGVYLYVDQIDALAHELHRSAAYADVQVVDHGYGTREIHVTDPWGNHLAFAERTG